MVPIYAPMLQKTIPLAPIHLFTKQIASTFVVSRIVDPQLIAILFASSFYAATFFH